MSGAVVKTNSAEIRASRMNKDDIEALIEMRESIAKNGRAEIAEREAVIAENQQAIDGIKVNLKRLGVDVGGDGAPIVVNAPRVRRGRKPPDDDTLIARVRCVIVERGREMTPEEVAIALGFAQNEKHSVEGTLYRLANRGDIAKVGKRKFGPKPVATRKVSVRQRIIDSFKKMPALYEMKAAEVQKLAGAPKIQMHRIHMDLGVLSREKVLERTGKGLYRLIKKDA